MTDGLGMTRLVVVNGCHSIQSDTIGILIDFQPYRQFFGRSSEQDGFHSDSPPKTSTSANTHTGDACPTKTA